MLRVSLMALTITCALGATARSRSLLDGGWKFHKVGNDNPDCNDADFPQDLNDKYCIGLKPQPQAADEHWCESTCCGDPTCEVWQWCPAGNTDCSPPGSCWTGKKDSCETGKGWVSRGRDVARAPDPTPGDNCDSPYCTIDYDDKPWRTLDFSHDMVPDNDFSESNDTSHGHMLHSKGWYRLHFEIPSSAKGKSVWVDFDGVHRNSAAYLNGKAIGSHLNGFSLFHYDITEAAVYGGNNVLAVYVDATQPDGWWFDGGSIFRHVWLNVAGNIHVAPLGVHLPAKVSREISSKATADATLSAETTVVNSGTQDTTVIVKTLIKDPTGSTVATTQSKSTTIKAGSRSTVIVDIPVKDAQLWSEVAPRMYSCETSVLVASSEVDSVTDEFNIQKMK